MNRNYVIKRFKNVSVFFVLTIVLLAGKSAKADAASASQGGIIGEVEWYFDSGKGELRIYGTGATPDYMIDSDQFPPWFPSDGSNDDLNAPLRWIKTITIEEGVTYVGDNLFHMCFEATSASLPSSLRGIGEGAFLGCSSLKTVNIPDGLSVIPKSLFANCAALETVTIPASVTTLEGGAFRSCQGLKTVTFAKGCELKHVGSDIFSMTPPYTDGRVFKYYLSDTGAYDAFRTMQEEIAVLAEAYPINPCNWLWIGLDDSGNEVTRIAAGDSIPKHLKDGATKASINGATVTGIDNMIWTGKAQKIKPVVKISGKTLIAGKDYNVIYRNNKNIGKASVIITGIGNYDGKITKSFKILPKGVKIRKLAGGPRRIAVTWTRQTKQITGYQIHISTKKNFVSKRNGLVKNNKKVSTVIKNLKSKKMYYVRIRTWKKVGSTRYYSKWSKVKRVRTK